MKAIHVKIQQPTERQPMRFKATGLNLCKVQANEKCMSASANAAYVAQQLLDDYNSTARLPMKVVDVGELPDGSFAVLITGKR